MIVFRALNKEDITRIVHLELDKVALRLKDHNIRLTATPAALGSLADQGYDPEMGARPLRRIIQQKVEDQLSDALLSGTFHDGDNIIVDLNAAGDIILLREEAPAEEAAVEPSA